MRRCSSPACCSPCHSKSWSQRCSTRRTVAAPQHKVDKDGVARAGRRPRPLRQHLHPHPAVGLEKPGQGRCKGRGGNYHAPDVPRRTDASFAPSPQVLPLAGHVKQCTCSTCTCGCGQGRQAPSLWLRRVDGCCQPRAGPVTRVAGLQAASRMSRLRASQQHRTAKQSQCRSTVGLAL